MQKTPDRNAITVTDGLICAYDVTDAGEVRPLERAQLDGRPEPGCWRWIHLDRVAPAAIEWLRDKSGLDDIAVETLLAEDTRPRCTAMKSGTLIILRGVNLNPGASPEDMVSVRLWVEGDRVISLRHRRIFAIQEIRDALDGGQGPGSVGDFVAWLAASLAERIGGVIREIEDDLDRLEEDATGMPPANLRDQLVAVRRTAIPMRRYLSPQRDAFQHFQTLKAEWMGDETRARLHQTGDETMRQVEDLDALRERAGLLHEELANRQSEQMNRNMYLLSVVAAIFLPLGFVTGLLGINVGGVPLADNALGFVIVSVVLVVLVAAEIFLFKLLRWI